MGASSYRMAGQLLFGIWFKQKAVAILLGLFSLGIQDIRIGPKPPEFISKGVLDILVDMFGLKLITTAEEDMNAMLALS